MKKTMLFGLLVMAVSQGAFASEALKYNCHVTRWDPSKEINRICGDITLSIDDQSLQDLKDCGVTVAGGSAATSKGKVMTVVLGTNASKLSGISLRDMTSLALYPASAPKEFQLSLLPGSIRYGKYSIDMECAANDSF